IEFHTTGTVQAHQRLALTSLSVANAKAIRLNIPLGEEGAWDGCHRGFVCLHHRVSPSSPGPEPLCPCRPAFLPYPVLPGLSSPQGQRCSAAQREALHTTRRLLSISVMIT